MRNMQLLRTNRRTKISLPTSEKKMKQNDVWHVIDIKNSITIFLFYNHVSL